MEINIMHDGAEPPCTDKKGGIFVRKRIYSVILALAMLLTLLPVQAFALEEIDPDPVGGC